MATRVLLVLVATMLVAAACRPFQPPVPPDVKPIASAQPSSSTSATPR